MKLAFIGFGELGKQIHAFIKEKNASAECIYFDDILYSQKIVDSFPFNLYTDNKFADYNFIICLGYTLLKKKNQILQELIELNRKQVSFIHASSFIMSTAFVDDGTVCYPMCNIDKDVKIGKSVLINNSVVISHNSIVGDCCYLSPGIIVSGNVIIGNNTFIGAGSIIANNLSIGNNVTIGLGSVITKDIPDNSFVIGNPMKLVNSLQLK
jgi:sugar O-acyltransferase (sialic acid O-acetyltransferase NeuD family)